MAFELRITSGRPVPAWAERFLLAQISRNGIFESHFELCRLLVEKQHHKPGSNVGLVVFKAQPSSLRLAERRTLGPVFDSTL
jgi:hypothetical protein